MGNHEKSCAWRAGKFLGQTFTSYPSSASWRRKKLASFLHFFCNEPSRKKVHTNRNRLASSCSKMDQKNKLSSAAWLNIKQSSADIYKVRICPFCTITQCYAKSVFFFLMMRVCLLRMSPGSICWCDIGVSVGPCEGKLGLWAGWTLDCQSGPKGLNGVLLDWCSLCKPCQLSESCKQAYDYDKVIKLK